MQTYNKNAPSRTPHMPESVTLISSVKAQTHRHCHSHQQRLTTPPTNTTSSPRLVSYHSTAKPVHPPQRDLPARRSTLNLQLLVLVVAEVSHSCPRARLELVRRWDNHKLMIRFLSHVFKYLVRFVCMLVLANLMEPCVHPCCACAGSLLCQTPFSPRARASWCEAHHSFTTRMHLQL